MDGNARFFSLKVSRWMYWLLTVLTVLVVAWLSLEMGLVTFRTGYALEDSESFATIEGLQRSVALRQSQIQEREGALKIKETELAEREKLIFQQVEKYKRMIGDLESRLQKVHAESAEIDESLYKIYEKMNPKNSARIFNDMDHMLVGQILKKLNPTIAAEVLGNMSNEGAKKITEKFLTRKVLGVSETKGQ